VKISIHPILNKNPPTKSAMITESYHSGRPIISMNSKPSTLHSKNQIHIVATLRKTKTNTPKPVIIS
jgi:hypothetical protein